jgi:hypothetical protein
MPDRRRHQRGTPEGGSQRREIQAIVLGTFREMPGLCLHLNQAARLFDLRPQTCQSILDDMVSRGWLRRAHDRQYVAGTLDRFSPTPRLPHPQPLARRAG